MYPRRFPMIAVGAVLLVIVLLFAGASAMQRDAWTQGFMMGRLSAGSDGNSAALLPYLYEGGLRGPHFGGFWLLPLIGFGFLFVMGSRVFRHCGWRREEWARGGQQHHRGAPYGQRSPWQGWDDRPPEESGREDATGERI